MCRPVDHEADGNGLGNVGRFFNDGLTTNQIDNHQMENETVFFSGLDSGTDVIRREGDVVIQQVLNNLSKGRHQVLFEQNTPH